MKNVICVDLSILDFDQLQEFCDDHNFSYEVLLDLKNKTYRKLWLNVDGIGLAYNLCRKNIFKITDYEKVRLFTDVLDEFAKMKPYEPRPVEKFFDVDTILEKISKFGKDAITKEEKDFLDNL